jgi:hypothetical protein
LDHGKIPIDKNYEFEYRYYDRDTDYKYFNRKFEVLLLEKKNLRFNFLISMNNHDLRNMIPRIYKAKTKKSFDFGVTTLNWNDIKNTFLDFVVNELGEEKRLKAKKALGKLSSPKL